MGFLMLNNSCEWSIVGGVGAIHKDGPDTWHHNFDQPEKRSLTHFSNQVTYGRSGALDSATQFNEDYTPTHPRFLDIPVERSHLFEH